MSEKLQKLWLKNNTGAWGPFNWKLLREWFIIGWLPPETEVADAKEGPWRYASDVTKLWKVNKATQTLAHAFEAGNLESEKLPLSNAIANRLKELGWPGDVRLLRNYYRGNRLREQLEQIFPQRCNDLFDDPDWPTCWSWPCPAEQARRNAERTKTSPRDWSNDPVTPKQYNRLKWWAEKLRFPLPSPSTKGEASAIIEEWLEKHPELEEEWENEATRLRDADLANYELDLQVSQIAGDVDDWREFYGCNSVSDATTCHVLKIVGERRQNEPIDVFMERFFAEVRRQSPNLFTGGATGSPCGTANKGQGCLFVLAIVIVVLVASATIFARLP